MQVLAVLSWVSVWLRPLWGLPAWRDPGRNSGSPRWKLVSTTEPTCTASGKKVYKCEKCGEKKTERTDALGHDWSYCTVTKKPTCTEDGLLRCTCSRNASHVKEESMPALGHQWSEWTTRVSPGLTSSGTEERECSRCRAKETRRTAPLIQRKEYDLTLPVSSPLVSWGQRQEPFYLFAPYFQWACSLQIYFFLQSHAFLQFLRKAEHR